MIQIIMLVIIALLVTVQTILYFVETKRLEKEKTELKQKVDYYVNELERRYKND